VGGDGGLGRGGDVRSWLRLSGWDRTGDYDDSEREGDVREARVGWQRGHTLLDLRCLGSAPLKYEGYQREEVRIVVRYDLQNLSVLRSLSSATMFAKTRICGPWGFSTFSSRKKLPCM